MVISALGSEGIRRFSAALVYLTRWRATAFFFRIADGIHPKYRTPGRALIFQGNSGWGIMAPVGDIIRGIDKSIHFCRMDLLQRWRW